MLDYNKRLFSGGIRKWLHCARFYWAAEQLKPFNSIVELGCFDGKLLEFIPTPARYEGYDADLEGSMIVAQSRWTFPFFKASKPDEFNPVGPFDAAVCMETMEHIPPHLVDGFLRKFAEQARIALITVPNEKGILFLAKRTMQKLMGYGLQEYTFRELVLATLGRVDQFPRYEHKGFDYAKLIEQISAHFEIVSVTPLPFRFMPVWLGFTVAIVARAKPAALPVAL